LNKGKIKRRAFADIEIVDKNEEETLRGDSAKTNKKI